MKYLKHPLRSAMCVLAMAALVACGGGPSKEAEAQYLTLELNGTPMAFNVDVSANDPPSEPTVHFVTVGGRQTPDWSGSSFSFQLVSPGAELGTYDGDRDELHGTYYASNGRGQTTTYMAAGAPGTRFVMTLTRLDADGVAGTFSGVLKEHGAPDDAPRLKVTNGRFSARYNGR